MTSKTSPSSANDSSTRLAPGPRGTMLLGNLSDVRRLGMVPFYLQAWRDFGDIIRLKLGPMVIHQVVRSEHVRHVLVQNSANYPKGFSHDKLRMSLGYGILTSEGDLWARQRKLMQPTYTPKAVGKYADIMVDATEQMLRRWSTQAQDGAPLVINREMMRLTMSVISRSMFGLDISEDFADAGQALINILDFTAERTLAMIDPPLFIPTPANRRYKQSIHTVDSLLYKIIRERREQPPGEDLLWLLMNAKDEETGRAMEEKQLRDEVLITFFAGHETTALLLTWTWYLLAGHPEVAEKLHAELARVLGGRSPTLQDLPNLPYTRMVLDETLRLYSPVAIIARDPVADDEIAGYKIPAGSLMVVTPYITHRHPEYWNAPEAFDPERFTPQEIEKRPRFAYIPFGAGSRVCIGMHFALLEGTLVLADVAQRYRLRTLPDAQPLGTEYVGTLRPDGDVLMTLQAHN